MGTLALHQQVSIPSPPGATWLVPLCCRKTWSFATYASNPGRYISLTLEIQLVAVRMQQEEYSIAQVHIPMHGYVE